MGRDNEVKSFEAAEVYNYTNMSLPYAITGNYPSRSSTARLSYTKTITSFTGDEAWKNGDYTVTGSSRGNSSYDNGTSGNSQNNPENAFVNIGFNYNSSGRWWINSGGNTGLDYIDENGVQQTYYNGSPTAWISLEMPIEVKPYHFYFYQGASHAYLAVFFLELADGTLRKIGGPHNCRPTGKWNHRWTRRSGAMDNHDYYGKKIYMLLDRANNGGFNFHETGGIIFVCTVRNIKTITW